MPQSLSEWTVVITFLAMAGFWAMRVLVWLVRIHDELQSLNKSYPVIKQSVREATDGVRANRADINTIKQELGLA